MRYADNLRSIIQKVKVAKPFVKIILCTTTCVDLQVQVAVEYGIYRSNEDVAKYNEAMRVIAAECGVAMHDLHAVALAAGGLSEDGVHFTEEASAVLGQAVSQQLWEMNHSWPTEAGAVSPLQANGAAGTTTSSEDDCVHVVSTRHILKFKSSPQLDLRLYLTYCLCFQYVLTGQSNSLGTTDDPRDAADVMPPGPSTPEVSFFWSNVQDVDTPYGDSGGAITELQVQQGSGINACFWGPEIGFARRLRELQPASRILIVKASRGGGGSGHWAPYGHMRTHIIETVSAALAVLVHERFEMRALLYTQGESDGPDEAPAAGTRLGELATSLRELLPAAGGMKLVVGGIAALGDTRDIVRFEQAALCSRRDGCTYIDNRDLEATTRGHDSAHYGTQAKLELGARMANALVELEGRP